MAVSPAPILLVDDDIDVLETLGMILELGGYAVAKATHAAHALRLAAETDLYVALVDYRLVGSPMNGLELIARLRDATRCVSTADYPCADFALGSYNIYVYNNDDGTATFMVYDEKNRKTGSRNIFTRKGMPRKTRAETEPDGSNWPLFSTIYGLTPGSKGWGGT